MDLALQNLRDLKSVGFRIMGSKDQSTEPSSSHDELVQSAIAVCRLRGAKVTPLREAALTELFSTKDPVGAYDLKDQLSKKLGRTISAASVYRTLDFLCRHGVAARVESRNAYIACAHPGHDHACVLFVCNACGSFSEVEDRRLEQLLATDAKKLGFSIDHRVVELSGSCSDCQEAAC